VAENLEKKTGFWVEENKAMDEIEEKREERSNGKFTFG